MNKFLTIIAVSALVIRNNSFASDYLKRSNSTQLLNCNISSLVISNNYFKRSNSTFLLKVNILKNNLEQNNSEADTREQTPTQSPQQFAYFYIEPNLNSIGAEYNRNNNEFHKSKTIKNLNNILNKNNGDYFEYSQCYENNYSSIIDESQNNELQNNKYSIISEIQNSLPIENTYENLNINNETEESYENLNINNEFEDLEYENLNINNEFEDLEYENLNINNEFEKNNSIIINSTEAEEYKALRDNNNNHLIKTDNTKNQKNHHKEQRKFSGYGDTQSEYLEDLDYKTFRVLTN